MCSCQLSPKPRDLRSVMKRFRRSSYAGQGLLEIITIFIKVKLVQQILLSTKDLSKIYAICKKGLKFKVKISAEILESSD